MLAGSVRWLFYSGLIQRANFPPPNKNQNSFHLQNFRQRHPQKVPNQMNEITIGCSIAQFPSNAF